MTYSDVRMNRVSHRSLIVLNKRLDLYSAVLMSFPPEQRPGLVSAVCARRKEVGEMIMV